MNLPDYRTDFLFLGVTFYELLTDSCVSTQDILQLVHCHIARPPIPPHELNATIQTHFRPDFETDGENEDAIRVLGDQSDLERCAQQIWQKWVELNRCHWDCKICLNSFAFLKTVWTSSRDCLARWRLKWQE